MKTEIENSNRRLIFFVSSTRHQNCLDKSLPQRFNNFWFEHQSILYLLFKILLFLLYGYHTPQLKSIAIPGITFSFHNFKLLPNQNYLGLLIPLNLFWRLVKTVSITVTIINIITVLVSQCYLLWIFVLKRGSSKSQCALGSQNPLKTITPSFLPNLLLNLETIHAPIFQAINPQYIGFSCTLLKSGFFSKLPY